MKVNPDNMLFNYLKSRPTLTDATQLLEYSFSKKRRRQILRRSMWLLLLPFAGLGWFWLKSNQDSLAIPSAKPIAQYSQQSDLEGSEQILEKENPQKLAYPKAPATNKEEPSLQPFELSIDTPLTTLPFPEPSMTPANKDERVPDNFEYLLLLPEEMERLGIKAERKKVYESFYYPWTDGACYVSEKTAEQWVNSLMHNCPLPKSRKISGAYASPFFYAHSPLSLDITDQEAYWMHLLFYVSSTDIHYYYEKEVIDQHKDWFRDKVILAGYKLKTAIINDTLQEQLFLYAFPRTDDFYAQLEPAVAKSLKTRFGSIDTLVYKNFLQDLYAKMHRNYKPSYWLPQAEQYYYPDKQTWEQLGFRLRKRKLYGAFRYLSSNQTVKDTALLEMELQYMGNYVNQYLPSKQMLGRANWSEEQIPFFRTGTRAISDTLKNNELFLLRKSQIPVWLDTMPQEDYVFLVAGHIQPKWYHFLKPDWYRSYDTTILIYRKSPWLDSLLKDQPRGSGFQKKQNPFSYYKTTNEKPGYPYKFSIMPVVAIRNEDVV